MVPALAVAVLLLGLPMVLATALLHGDPGASRDGGAEVGGSLAPGGRAGAATSGDSGDAAPPWSRSLGSFLTWKRTILGGVVAVALLAGAAVGSVLVPRLAGDAPSATAALRGEYASLAVLPFVDLSETGDQTFLSDGITEELLNALGTISGLRVAARTSSFSLRDAELSAPQIGNRLNVEAILEGSVRVRGDQLRINVNLTDAAANAQVWSAAFDRDARDVFAVQEEIARSIVRALRGEDEADDEEGRSAATRDFEAYQMYLRGRFELNQRSPEAMERALDLFRSAIERDAEFALPYAGLADTYNLQALNFYGRPADLYPSGIEAAERALELDANLAEAHAALGLARFQYARDWSDAEAHFVRALELNPSYPNGHYFYSLFLSSQQRNVESVRQAGAAFDLDPLSAPVAMGTGIALYSSRRWDESLAAFQRAIDVDPGYYFNYSWLGLVHAIQGRDAEAVAAGDRALQLSPGSSLARSFVAEIYARVGRTEEANDLLRELAAQWEREGTVTATYMARAYVALGELDEAVGWLERASEAREGQITQLDQPGYESLRDDPRFVAIMREIGLR